MGIRNSKIRVLNIKQGASVTQPVETGATTTDKSTTNAEPVGEPNKHLESEVPSNPGFFENPDPVHVKTTVTLLPDDTKDDVSNVKQVLSDAPKGFGTVYHEHVKKKKKKEKKKKKKKQYLKEFKNKQESDRSNQQESTHSNHMQSYSYTWNAGKTDNTNEANTNDSKSQTMPMNLPNHNLERITSPSSNALSERNPELKQDTCPDRRRLDNPKQIWESQQNASKSTVTVPIGSQIKDEFNSNNMLDSAIQKRVKDPEKDDEQTKPEYLPALLHEKEKSGKQAFDDYAEEKSSFNIDCGSTPAENGQQLVSTKRETKALKKKQIAKYEQKIASLKDELETKRKYITKCEQELVAHKEEISELKKRPTTENKQETDSLKKELKIKKRDNTALNAEIDSLRKENDDLKNRMSRMMSDLVTDNNPNIADLSDHNRPNKLGERFSELYNNEWTDAYEDLITNGIGDIEVIELLLNLIMTIFNECRRIAAADMTALTKAVLQVTGSSEMTDDLKLSLKLYKDIRKKNYRNSTKLSNEIIQSLLPSGVQLTEHLEKYIILGYEICWLMSIQDPSLYLSHHMTKDAPFDKMNFREYTKTGELNDYVVWPVLFLYEDGPILQKGVMQAAKSKTEATYADQS